MEYRKYKAKTFQEAKLKMMLDVGNQAYIVSQKKVTEGGILGFFGKPMIEITAGIMEPGSVKPQTKSNNKEVNYESRLDPDFQRPNPVKQSQQQAFNHSNENPGQNENEELRNELNEIKSLIGKIVSEKNAAFLDSPVLSNSQENNNLPEENLNKNLNENEKTKEFIKMLLKDEDFDEDFIDIVCSLSSVEEFLRKEKDLGKIKTYIKQEIARIVETSSGIELENGQTNVIVVVGPTGVGKTTTLAKLGAYFGVFQKKKVKFISIDTYRVGAIQQLKLYADIMEIPFSKVNNVEELKMELYDREYDLILIDTTGRSQKNMDDIIDIRKYIDQVQGKVHVSLAISATTKYKDLVEILDKFDILNYTSIIITKLDETNSLGQVISAISPKKRSLSYVTFGQSVPEDIEEASKQKLFEMVLKA